MRRAVRAVDGAACAFNSRVQIALATAMQILPVREPSMPRGSFPILFPFFPFRM
jgi:hypothetical protein